MTAERAQYKETAVIDRRYSFAQLRFCGAGRLGAAVTARVFFNSAGRIDKLLFAGEKRMTSGADTDFDVLLRRTGMVDRPAGTGDFGLVILRMNVRFHDQKRVRKVGAIMRPRKQ
jgi:hypothetical protein